MCKRVVMKAVVIALTGVSLASSLFGIVSPGWRKSGDKSLGLFGAACSQDVVTNSSAIISTAYAEMCKNELVSSPLYIKVLVALLVLGVVFQVLALIWSLLSCVLVFLPNWYFLVAVLTGLAFVLNVSATGYYVIKNKEHYTNLAENINQYVQKNGKSEINIPTQYQEFTNMSGYSVIFIALSSVILLLTTIIALIVHCAGGSDDENVDPNGNPKGKQQV